MSSPFHAPLQCGTGTHYAPGLRAARPEKTAGGGRDAG